MAQANMRVTTVDLPRTTPVAGNKALPKPPARAQADQAAEAHLNALSKFYWRRQHEVDER